MALEITTVGASVRYAVETTKGTRPTSGYTTIPNIQQAPEISLDVEALDASDISDTITRYAAGRQDPGGAKSFTANHTEAFITAWEAMVSAYDTARAAGKQVWIEYVYPGATKSFFWSGIPLHLGSNGIENNAVSTIPASVICTGVAGWLTASTQPANT